MDWEKVDVHCLANTLWRLVAERDAPPRGPIAAGGEYDLTRYTQEDYAGNLNQIIAGATAENPAARPTMARFEQQLANWLDGREIRDSVMRLHERMSEAKTAVLRYLIAEVRREPHFQGFGWDVAKADDPSGIGDLTDGEVGEALDELHHQWQIVGDRQQFFGGRTLWTHLYPTIEGVRQVENLDVVLAQMAPLLRGLLTAPVQIIDLDRREQPFSIGNVELTPAEAYFQLRMLSESLLIAADEQPGGGSGVHFLNIRVTPQGRQWLVEQYA